MATAGLPVVSPSPLPHSIVVDLDGTLVSTDTFLCSIFEALRRKPLSVLSIARAQFRGRAYAKEMAAREGAIDAGSLPYNLPLIEYLKEQRTANCRLILATGADQSIAAGVANHLGIFDEVIASSYGRNVVGAEKLKAIRNSVGDEPFTYAGNSRRDVPVWRYAQTAILVTRSPAFHTKLVAAGIPVGAVFQTRRTDWKRLLHCLRPHQWQKNLLVFSAGFLAHQIGKPQVLLRLILAFVAMCFCASGLYVWNDLLDLQADRWHPKKRLRPIACGEVSVGAAVGLCVLSLLGALGVMTLLPLPARLLVGVYAAGSAAYSLVLKKMMILDVVTLAMLYGMRVLVGGAAAEIPISVWTLAFSLYIFTGLAILKRLADLRKREATESEYKDYREYKAADINQLSSLASASAYSSVLVLALYINSPEVTKLYAHPTVLWLLCPVLIYWLSRITLLANRGEMDYDPVAFAMKDKTTWMTGAVAAAILGVSIFR